MKILLVEDEIKTVDYLKRGLSEQGYNVDVAMDGLDGLHLASTGEYDAIILDLMLPSMDGISILKNLRPANGNYPHRQRCRRQPVGRVQRRSRRLSGQTFFLP